MVFQGSRLVLDRIDQLADAFRLDLDDISRLQEDRWIETGTSPGWCSGYDDVAWNQGCEGRDVIDLAADRIEHPAGAVVLPDLAIDAGGDPDILKLGGDR